MISTYQEKNFIQLKNQINNMAKTTNEPNWKQVKIFANYLDFEMFLEVKIFIDDEIFFNELVSMKKANLLISIIEKLQKLNQKTK